MGRYAGVESGISFLLLAGRIVGHIPCIVSGVALFGVWFPSAEIVMRSAYNSVVLWWFRSVLVTDGWVPVLSSMTCFAMDTDIGRK